MTISLIINTAASDPWASGSNPHRAAGYRQRQHLLRNHVLPAALAEGFDEVIVAGVFEPGPGYRYVPVQPRTRDRADALWQREIGARYATGDVLVFCHDDHTLGEGFAATLRRNWLHTAGWDLLIPRRLHGSSGTVLNNGFEDGPNGVSYMGGHALAMRRWLWAEVPWNTLSTEYWDTTMTRLWREAGGSLVFTDDLIHLDMEAMEDEA